MTSLAIVFCVIASGLLTLGPAFVLSKEEMRFTTGVSFCAIVSAGYVAGLLGSVPITVILVLFFLWLRYVALGESRVKNTLFLITVCIAALSLLLNLIHLPIRLALKQSSFKIGVNITGILANAAMCSACIEWLIRRRSKV